MAVANTIAPATKQWVRKTGVHTGTEISYMQGIWTFLLGTSGGLLFLWQGLGACKKNTMWNSYPECLRWMVADISAWVTHHPETFMVNGERCRTFADQRSMCPLDDKLRHFDSKMLASPEPHYTVVCCIQGCGNSWQLSSIRVLGTRGA